MNPLTYNFRDAENKLQQLSLTADDIRRRWRPAAGSSLAKQLAEVDDREAAVAEAEQKRQALLEQREALSAALEVALAASAVATEAGAALVAATEAGNCQEQLRIVAGLLPAAERKAEYFGVMLERSVGELSGMVGALIFGPEKLKVAEREAKAYRPDQNAALSVIDPRQTLAALQADFERVKAELLAAPAVAEVAA